MIQLRYNKKKSIDYILVFLLISISGNPFFSGTNILSIIFLFTLYIFIKRKKKIEEKFLIFISILFIITVFQTVIFSFFSLITIIGLFMRIFIAYMVVKIVTNKFIDNYIKIMYLLSLFSLFFYIISNLNLNLLIPFSINVSGEESLYPRYSIFGIFTYITPFIDRNSGPFWEPGAFAGYLIIAFIFNYFSSLSKKNKINKILLITIISTFSTTVYLAIFSFFFLIYFKNIKNFFLKIFSVMFILSIGYYAYFNFDFLGKKIENQYSIIEKNINPYLQNTDTQRFLNILRDIKDFEEHEIIGRGTNPITRYSFDSHNQIRTVGITDILVKFGIIFFILMLYYLYTSICSYLKYQKKKENLYCLSIFTTIIITLMSEVYFNYPFYWSLLFLYILNKPKYKDTNI